MTKIFVYGTLKEGCSNHTRFEFDKNNTFLRDAELLGAKI